MYNGHMITAQICNTAEQWDEIIHELGGHPLQLWGWGALKAAHGWRAHRLKFTDDTDRIVGAAQVLTRTLPGLFRQFCYVPRGPVWREGHAEAVLESLVTYAKQHIPGVVVSIEPDVTALPALDGWRPSSNTILIPETLILDLSQDSSTLMSAMSKKTRQYIRKSEREGVTVTRVRGRDAIEQCLAIYHETAARAGFALHGDDYYFDVSELLGESSVIFAAYEGLIPIAFVWLALSATTAFELYGGMNDRGQELRANYLLKWHAITTCKEWGVSRYDMNGLLGDGVSTFKRGFADHEDRLVGSYDYPLSPLYILWSKGLPLAKSVIRKITPGR